MNSHDEAVANMAALLFGAGYEDLSKSGPDSSEISTPASRAAAKEQSKKRTRRLAQVGVGANAIAIAGGTHALGAAAANPNLRGPKHLDDKGMPGGGGKISNKVYEGGKWLEDKQNSSPRLKRAATWAAKPKNAGKLAGAALGLHVVELASDGVAHHFMSHAAKDNKVKVHKADAFHIGTTIVAGGNHKYRKAKKVRKLEQDELIQLQAQKASAQAKMPVQKNEVDIEFVGEISKLNADKRQVFGWASVTKIDGQDVLDRQGDYIAMEEVEKSAYHYVHNSRKGGDMHQRDGEVPLHKSDMIESFVVTPEKLVKMGLDENALPHGWWVGYQVNDENLWEMVKDGRRVGFSIHGKGVRTPL